MAAALTPTLINKDFQNWLKGALAVLFAKEGLIDLVGHENIDFQNHLLQTLYTQKGILPGTTCSSCTTANVLSCPTAGFCSKGKKCKAHDSKVPDKKPNQVCPNGVCSHIRDAIRNEHRFKGPSWKNTDARRWCSDAFQLSKCFMPPDGYSDNTCLADTDFNGILAVVINNNRFQRKMSVNLGLEPNICTEARIIGREIRHSANHLLSDRDLMKYIDGLITLLSDPAYLAADVKANDAVGKLKQLKSNTLTIHAADITKVLNESIKSTFDDQQNLFLHDIQEHFKRHKNDSVEVIDRKIQEFVDKRLAELKAQTDRGKDELNAEKEKGKIELKLQSKMGKDELQTQLEQGKGDLNSKVEKGKLDLGAKTEQGLDKLHAQVKQGADKLKVQTSDGKDELSSLIAIGKSELEATTNQGKDDIDARRKQALEEISRSAVVKSGSNEDSLLQDLKEDLMTYYRENESMIPAAPLVDEHKVPIEELYVLPPMWAYDKPLSFGLGKNTQTEEHRSDAQGKKQTTVSQLFLSDKNVRYRKIYITADAGYGKTSLSQKLTMTWCQSHSPLMSLTKKYKGDELAAMKYFDFLFLLHLRDYQSEPLCNLDDLIMHMLSNNLSRNTLYTKEFLQRLLHEKTCLIVLDGLDEWAHTGKCRRTPAVPHNNHPDSCTLLTTSRPWKLGTIGLSEHNIDRHIEISQLDWQTRNKLETNAVRILNERNLNRAGKNIANFDKAVKSVKIGDIIYNPYILLQLMCAFFCGLPIGKSKCEIYSNITEFTLERGLNKKDIPDIHVQTNDIAPVPNCMNENETCKRYYILLMKLGKLAFYTLFSEKRESSLIFDRRIVTQYMTEQEIEFCLKVGLLCQTKDSSIIAVKRYHVFFQHKSVHEFFSAIYITSEWQNESVKSTIPNICSSLSGILEMSNVFVFVCGINPEVYTCISGELQTIVDLDDVTRQYRTYMYSGDYDPVYYDSRRPIESYQSMQVQCLQECVRNGHDSCSIHLHDYILTEEDLTSLKIIINFNKGNVKSLQLSYPYDQITEFMQLLDPGVFTSLETLRVGDCGKEPVWLADILTESARTLKCLTLSAPYPGISLSDISITALTGLTCLQSLYLVYVNMTHSNLKCLYAYISQTTTLTQLKLKDIECSDHVWGQYRDCDVTLDLHRLNELKMLHLDWVPCRELYVNPACLEKLEFRTRGVKMTARASAILWQDLRAAPVLSSLTLYRMTSCQEMIQTIPTLTQLQHLKLDRIDMDDVIPLSPAMTQLKLIELFFVKMSSAAWRGLLLSVGQQQHPIRVKLASCFGPSNEEWRTIVNLIKTTPTVSLLPDLSIDEYGFADLTLSSGMWSDKSLTQNKEFRTVQANQQQRTERVERYEPEEGAYKIHESAEPDSPQPPVREVLRTRATTQTLQPTTLPPSAVGIMTRPPNNINFTVKTTSRSSPSTKGRSPQTASQKPQPKPTVKDLDSEYIPLETCSSGSVIRRTNRQDSVPEDFAPPPPVLPSKLGGFDGDNDVLGQTYDVPPSSDRHDLYDVPPSSVPHDDIFHIPQPRPPVPGDNPQDMYAHPPPTRNSPSTPRSSSSDSQRVDSAYSSQGLTYDVPPIRSDGLDDMYDIPPSHNQNFSLDEIPPSRPPKPGSLQFAGFTQEPYTNLPTNSKAYIDKPKFMDINSVVVPPSIAMARIDLDEMYDFSRSTIHDNQENYKNLDSSDKLLKSTPPPPSMCGPSSHKYINAAQGNVHELDMYLPMDPALGIGEPVPASRESTSTDNEVEYTDMNAHSSFDDSFEGKQQVCDHPPPSRPTAPPPRPIKPSKGFYHCLKNNDQIGILDLLQKGQCQDQHKLKELCKTFGRKHPLIKIACTKICEIIKNKNPKLPDVWPAYKMKPEEEEVDETNICFVIETEDIDHTVMENIEILQIARKSPNAENRVVKDYAYEHQFKLTGSDIKRIGKVINEEISLLRKQHSNLVRIVPSPIKSIGFNTVNHQNKIKPCIALFVRAKGIIPLQEECFPKKLGDFETDVREGYCELAVGGGPHEIHDSLKIGCAIASFGARLYGTIGGFLNHEECGECALTSSHVLSADEPKCVQPISDCQTKVFGETIRSCFDPEIGVDAALIKIDKRHPSGGHFPDCSPEEMKLAGIIDDRKLPFTSGQTLSINESNYDDYQENIILKYGAKTTFRRGVLEAFDLPTDVMVHGKLTAFNNQILINSRTTYGKFAEKGDSGSLVFILDNGHSFAIGIVMAVTDDGDAYCNPISKVLEVFECESLKSFIPKSPAVSRKAAEKVKFDKDSSADLVRKENNNNDAPFDDQYRNNAEDCFDFQGARPKSTCKAPKVVTNNYTSQQITELTEKNSNQRTSSPETPTVKSRERFKKIIEGTKSSGSTNKLKVLSKRSTSYKTGVNMTSSRLENNDVLKKADLNKSIDNDDETM